MRKLEKVGMLVCIERVKLKGTKHRNEDSCTFRPDFLPPLLSVSDAQTYSIFSLNFTQNFAE